MRVRWINAGNGTTAYYNKKHGVDMELWQRNARTIGAVTISYGCGWKMERFFVADTMRGCKAMAVDTMRRMLSLADAVKDAQS